MIAWDGRTLADVPAGVVSRLMDKAAADLAALDMRIKSEGLGTSCVGGRLTHVFVHGEWVVPPELRTLDQRAVEWLAGVGAMEVQP